MSPVTSSATLSEYNLPPVRCSGCFKELPGSAQAEPWANPHVRWVVIQCPECKRWTPVRLEETR